MKRSLIALAVVAAAASCGPPPVTGGPCADTSAEFKCDTSAAAVSTATVYSQVFTPSCVSTCHNSPGGSALAYGNYSDAASLQSGSVGVKSVYAGSKALLKKVDPDNLQNSTLWLKVIGGTPGGKKGPECESPGNPMPDATPFVALSDAQKKVIKDWICSGAKP